MNCSQKQLFLKEVETQTMDNWTSSPEIAMILEFVHWFRLRQETVVTRGIKPEPSCIMFGEFNNLIYCQLITTPEFDDGWLELRNSPQVVSGVLLQIANDIEHFISRGVPVELSLWGEAQREAIFQSTVVRAS